MENKGQIGSIGYRDPEDRYKITKTEPIYAEVTPELQRMETATFEEMGKLFAVKMKQYIDGGGLSPKAIAKRGARK